MADSPLLTVYGREDCHLCRDMVDALEDFQAGLAFELQWVDVDADPGLARRYGPLVPVLMAGEREICHYFLDAAALNAYFTEIR